MWATPQGAIYLGAQRPSKKKKKSPVFFFTTANFHIKLVKWSLGRPYYHVNLLHCNMKFIQSSLHHSYSLSYAPHTALPTPLIQPPYAPHTDLLTPLTQPSLRP